MTISPGYFNHPAHLLLRTKQNIKSHLSVHHVTISNEMKRIKENHRYIMLLGKCSVRVMKYYALDQSFESYRFVSKPQDSENC